MLLDKTQLPSQAESGPDFDQFLGKSALSAEWLLKVLIYNIHHNKI